METDLDSPNSTTRTTSTGLLYHNNMDDDSTCSTPYVSAPSSPIRTLPFFYYSAPTSPMHFIFSTTTISATATSATTLASTLSSASSDASFEFEFSSRFDSPSSPHTSGAAAMSSADELFLNGQIRPMKLSAHLLRHQPPLLDSDSDVFDRSSRFRDRSLRRRTRSLSPLRSSDWLSDVETENAEIEKPKQEEAEIEIERDCETPPSGSGSAASSRCSSAGRSSKRWVFLRDFLRSKSEGSSSSSGKFWHKYNISFSPAKEKEKKKAVDAARRGKKSPAAGGKRRSAHEMHYTWKREKAEEMRKRTYLPYRQGLLGCLGFNSKSYGAFHGFARALNPVSSR